MRMNLLLFLGMLFGWLAVVNAEEPFRTFTSSDGGKTIKARLLEVDTATLTLKLEMEGGKMMTVDAEAFSEADIKYATAYAMRRKAEALDPAIDEIARKYRGSREVILKERKDKVEESEKAYKDLLKASEESARAEGKDSEAQAIAVEFRRVGNVTLPVEPSSNFPRSLHAARRMHMTRTDKANEKAFSELEAISKSYIRELDRIEKQTSTTKTELLAQITDQRSYAKSGIPLKITDFTKELVGTKWALITDPSDIKTFGTDGKIDGTIPYEIRDAETVTVFWGEGGNGMTWKLGKDGTTLVLFGKRDRVLVQPGLE